MLKIMLLSTKFVVNFITPGRDICWFCFLLVNVKSLPNLGRYTLCTLLMSRQTQRQQALQWLRDVENKLSKNQNGSLPCSTKHPNHRHHAAIQ